MSDTINEAPPQQKRRGRTPGFPVRLSGRRRIPHTRSPSIPAEGRGPDFRGWRTTRTEEGIP